MYGQGAERCRQRRMQADGAARAVSGRGLQQGNLVAADRRADNHYRCRIKAAAFDQLANGAFDAATDAVIIGAQPAPTQRRGAVHSAAVLSPPLCAAAPAPVSPVRLST